MVFTFALGSMSRSKVSRSFATSARILGQSMKPPALRGSRPR